MTSMRVKEMKKLHRYIVDVHHRDRYEFDSSMGGADDAIKIAKNCAMDNYGPAYVDRATFDVIRVDIPTIGDMSDTGTEGA